MTKANKNVDNVITLQSARNSVELKGIIKSYSSFYESLDSDQLINETRSTIVSLERNILNKQSIAKSKALLSELKKRYSTDKRLLKDNPIHNFESTLFPKIERLISYL